MIGKKTNADIESLKGDSEQLSPMRNKFNESFSGVKRGTVTGLGMKGAMLTTYPQNGRR